MHAVRRAQTVVLKPHPTYANRSRGYASASLIDHKDGSVHTGLTLNELAAGGMVDPHVHSFEEGIYLLQGEAILAVGDRAYCLSAGDFAALKVGTSHGWRNTGASPVRWLQMAAPQPKPIDKERDTFFIKGASLPSTGASVASAATSGDLIGHFDASQIPPEDARPAGLAKGVFLKWLIDEQLGARHHRLLFLEYQPGANIGLHDHTFEEAYFILSGEVHATLDGERYLTRAGDVLWTGVGCVHAFANVGTLPVRWLETFSPQPPAENVFRFMAEWEQRGEQLEGG